MTLLRCFLLALSCSILIATGARSEGSDGSKESYIYVSALERCAPDETPETWRTMVYKIDVGSARIVQKKIVAERGATTRCVSLPGGKLMITVEEGIYGNGSIVGEHICREYTLDKASLNLEKKTTKPGDINEPFPPSVEGLDSSQWRDYRGKKGIVFLGKSPITERTYLLSNYINDMNLKDLELKIQDERSSRELESISLGVGDRDLARIENKVFLKERFLICLFYGRGRIGYYGSGYVMIVDLDSKQVNYVTIGSNPACGIAY